MTLTALLVLVAGLGGAEAPRLAPSPVGAIATAPAGAEARSGPRVTCTLRVVHASPKLDSAMVVGVPPGPPGGIVRDSVSPCETAVRP